MYLLYSILLTIGVVALLPRFVFDAFRHGKYVAGWRERLGYIREVPTKVGPIIWLHSVSVGETQAARPLVKALRRHFPEHTLVVSTTTLTGQRVAREVFSDDAALVFYFPFDWSWTVRRSLRAIQPSLVLIMETELWPNFLRETRKLNIPTVIVNGRLSQRSFSRFRFVPRFTSRVVNDIDLALMQTETDAERMRSLGLPDDRVKVTGNIKFDVETETVEDVLTDQFRRRFGFGNGRPLIVAASTHDPEERIAVDAFKELVRHSAVRPRLLIAPRHPERFSQTRTLLRDCGLKWAQRSDASTTGDAECDVILLDSIGELRAAYPLADVVFVGGSLVPSGGHNVLEPIAHGKCVVTGPHTSNFASIMSTFVQADALVQLPEVPAKDVSRTLADAFKELLANKDRRDDLASRSLNLIEKNRGATEQTVNYLGPLLKRKD
jgi:3-deoxy-D-manno-octulosonic-acid transferase